jgi:alpha-glucosidase (family GH31 glycosyl hydrolase)
MPLHVRAGAMLPLGPVKQYVEEPVTAPLHVIIFPGADGTCSQYEDDGRTFDYRKGAWMRLAMTWTDASRVLSIQLAPGSRFLPPAQRVIELRVAGEVTSRIVTFDGKALEVRL